MLRPQQEHFEIIIIMALYVAVLKFKQFIFNELLLCRLCLSKLWLDELLWYEHDTVIQSIMLL